MDRTTLQSRAWTAVPMPTPMPGMTVPTAPSMALSTSSLAGLGDTSAGISPEDLVQRLPSIVNPTPDVLTSCDPFTMWVSENPGLAGLGLAAAAYLLIFSKGKR